MISTDKLIQNLSSEAKSTSVLPSHRTRYRRFVVGAILLWMAFLALSGFSFEWREIVRRPWMVFHVASALAIFLTSSWKAFELGVPGAEKHFVHRVWPFVLLAIWIVVVALEKPELMSEMFSPAAHAYTQKCARVVLLWSLFPSACFIWMIRRAQPLHRSVSGGFVCLAGAALAMAAIHVECVITHAAHVFVGHILPAVLCMFVGFAFGAWFLKKQL